MLIKIAIESTKHVELWAKNAFDDWQKYQGYDIEKFITNISKNKNLIKNFLKCCFCLCCKLPKKNGLLYPPTRQEYFFYKIYNFVIFTFWIFFFCFLICKFLFVGVDSKFFFGCDYIFLKGFVYITSLCKYIYSCCISFLSIFQFFRLCISYSFIGLFYSL